MRDVASSVGRASAWVALVGVMLAVCAGCRAHADDVVAEEAADATASAHAEGAILAACTDGVTASTTADAAAQQAAASAALSFGGACASAKVVGATVTYSLSDCSGRFGLSHATGEVTVSFAVAKDGLHARAKATGLAVEDATVDIDAEGVHGISGTTQTLSVTTSGAGMGAHAVRFVRKGSYVVSWAGDGCLGLNGAWATSILGKSASTTVAGYVRCAAKCPAPGGQIHHHDPDVDVDLAFDGSATARWTSSRGRDGELSLGCTP
jgi:hypothetical protein